MKTIITALSLALVSSNALAWSQPTHKKMVIDAMNFMNSDMATPEQKRAVEFYIKAAGGSLPRAADAIGQACYDTDNFKDVRLGFWWTGYYYAPVMNLAQSFVNYTSYHHFTTMSRGEDAHGNPNGGYNYQFRTPNGSLGKGEFLDIDKIAAATLWNMELKKSDYDSTEAKYRQGSYSTYNQYRDFQTIPWQPSANASKYWFDQFLKQPSFQTIGYSLHFVTDASQPHHTQSTSSNHHAGWEGWVDDNYSSGKFYNPEKVRLAVAKYSAMDSLQNITRSLAAQAYSRPEPLYDTSFETRRQVAEQLIPEGIAAAVVVLTKGVNCLNRECGM